MRYFRDDRNPSTVYRLDGAVSTRWDSSKGEWVSDKTALDSVFGEWGTVYVDEIPERDALRIIAG